jgi:hypothetical protein
VAIRYWRNSELTEDDWKNLVRDSYLPETIFQELFSGILTLTLSVFRLSEKKFIPDVLVKELTSLGYAELITSWSCIILNFCIYRLTLEQAKHIISSKTPTSDNIPKFFRVKDTKWRIDVTISTR